MSLGYVSAILVSCFIVVPDIRFGQAVMLNGAGASFPRDVYASWIPAYKAYRSQFKTLEMTYEAIGSGGGQARIQGLSGPPVQYAGSDSLLTSMDYELYPDLQMFPTMAGAVVLSFNLPRITSLNLTMSHIVGIYMGTLKWWNDTSISSINPSIELPHREIIPIARRDKSGTTEIFTSALSSDPTWRQRFGIFNRGLDPNDQPYVWDPNVVKVYGHSTRGMAGMIVSIKYSVGYLVMSDAAISLLDYAFLQNEAGNVVTPSIASVQSSMDEFVYTFDTRLTTSLASPSSPDAYPMAGYTYMIVKRTTMENCESAKELVRYVQWFYTNKIPRKDCEHLFMTPLSKKVYSLVLEHVINKMKCQGKNIMSMVKEEIAKEETSLQTWRLPVYITAPLFGFVFLIVVPGYIMWKLTRTYWAILKNEWKVDSSVIQFHTRSTSYSVSKQSLCNGYGSNKVSPSYSTLESSNSNASSLVGEWGKRNVVLNELIIIDRHLKYRAKKRLLWMINKISHKNITVFYGLVDMDGVYHSLSENNMKSSLANFLRNSSLNATDDLKFAITSGIVSGMTYLHKHHLIHGQLTCSTCYFDVSWTVKVCRWEECDIAGLCQKNIISPDFKIISKWDAPEFWTAPEIFQYGSNPTKASDVYSFGIIMQEIFSRELPFVNCSKDLSPSEVLEQVVMSSMRPPFTPNTHIAARVLMESAWETDPIARPSFASLQQGIAKTFTKQRTITDCIVRSLEQFVSGLENQLSSQAKEGAESMTIKPAITAIFEYSRGPLNLKEFISVTVMALDIQGIDNLVKDVDGSRRLDIIRQLANSWNTIINDSCILVFDVTTDGFKLLSGAPEQCHDHVGLIARTAMAVQTTAKVIMSSIDATNVIGVRVGIASGPIMVDVAGLPHSQPLVVGEALNEARVLMNAAEPGTILISNKAEIVLTSLNKWVIYQNQDTVIKDNNPIKTFWLTGSKDTFLSTRSR